MEKVDILLLYLDEAIDSLKLYNLASNNRIPGKKYRDYKSWKTDIETEIRNFLFTVGRSKYKGIEKILLIECSGGIIYVSEVNRQFVFGHWNKTVGLVYSSPIKANLKKCDIVYQSTLLGL